MNSRNLLIISLILILAVLVNAQAVSGTGNNVNICQPKVTVNSCGSCCKTKTVYKDKIVTVEKKVVVEKVVEKPTKTKHHIISVFGHKTFSGYNTKYYQNGSNNGAIVESETSVVPGLMYQYIFDNGLVPMGALDANKHGQLGIGYNF